MDFWKSRQDKEDAESHQRRPSTFEQLVEFAKEEAVDAAKGAAVEYLTGGWLTGDHLDLLPGGDDDDDDGRQAQEKRGSFEARLERELAKLKLQSADAPQVMPVAVSTSVPETSAQVPPAPSEYVPVSRPTFQRQQGFGRKGL